MAHTSISFGATAALASQANQAIPVDVRSLLSDADQAGVTPAAPDNGDAYIINNWAAGIYVGIWAGVARVDGDCAMWSDALAGWVRLALNNGGAPATNLRCLVAAAGAAGSFVGLEDNIVLYDGTAWEATAPVDDAMVRIIGDEAIFAFEQFSYDLPTTTWISMGKSNLSLGTTHIVDKTGNDDTGDGSVDRPYLTIAAAYAVAVAGDEIYIGPGIYAEQVNLAIRVNVIEFVPGTVTVQTATVGGATFTIGGLAGTSVVRLHAIINTNNATIADVALLVTNLTPAAVVADVKVGTLNGGLLGTAFRFTGDATNAEPTVATVYADSYVGSIGNITTGNAADLCEIRGNAHNATPATWCIIPGGAGTGGVVRFKLYSTAAGILNIGNNTALGADVFFEAGTFIGGQVNLHNNAGAGITTFLGEAAADVLIAAIEDQIYHRRIGHWLEINLLNVDLDPGAPAAITMYTVPADQTFEPMTIETINRLANTAAALDYRYNGSGNGTLVAATGGAILVWGITLETTLREVLTVGQVVAFDVTTASGVGADNGDCRVIGAVQNV